MEAFVLLDTYQEALDEKRTQLPLPGEILYWSDPGTPVTSSGQPVAEILLAFGRFAVVILMLYINWFYSFIDFIYEQVILINLDFFG